MNRPGAILVFCGVLGAWVSCATSPPHVRVEGNPRSLEPIAGRWEGEYTGGPRGRTGKIAFEFEDGTGSPKGAGQIWMEPRGEDETPVPRDRPTVDVPPGSLSLHIEYVRVTDGRVSGRLEPYWDPDCHCEARTTFEGNLRGDVIEGEFSASTATLPVGHWKVRRVAPANR